MSEDFKEAMSNYFGSGTTVLEKSLSQKEEDYTYSHERDKTQPERTGEIVGSRRDGWSAEASMATIEDFADILEKVMKAAWGSDWGTFSHATSVNIELEEINLPLIVYDTLTRTPSDGTNPKGTLFNSINEIVDGEPTGEVLQIHKLFYDCVVEFSFFGNNSKEAADIMDRFESLIRTTTYLIKRKGLAELVFMKEQPADESSKYTVDVPMRSLLYYVKLEKTIISKASLLRKIEIELEMN